MDLYTVNDGLPRLDSSRHRHGRNAYVDIPLFGNMDPP